jgi:hypothetical protein
MTTTSRVQADLLQELREAAPIAVVPETAARRPQPARPAVAEQPSGTTLELRVTPHQWSPLRIRGVSGGAGLSAQLGPVRLSLRMPGR